MFEENTINQNMSYQLKKETIYNTDFFPLSSGPMSHKNVQGKPECSNLCLTAALQAATILVAMASGNKIWRLNFPHRSPIWRPGYASTFFFAVQSLRADSH